MLSAMLGRKVGMTQIFGDRGAAIPVTVIEAGPCTVTQVKTAASDGYEAVQLGFGTAKTQEHHAPDPRPPRPHPAADAAQKRRQQQEAREGAPEGA